MRVDETVLSILSTAQVAGNQVVLVGQLERKLYEKTNKVLEAAGGKWVRKARAHVFDCEAASRIDQILVTGEVAVPKDEFNFFPTPANIVAKLIELADIEPGMRVLEPEAGQGAIALACADIGALVDCVELMEQNFAKLQAMERFASVRNMDFLQLQPTPIYDRIVMNPPFLKQADIHHVNHALEFLHPDGGLLVSVMSAGVTFRMNNLSTSFRQLVAKRGGRIECLPEDAFKSSGTSVNTVVVSIPAQRA